MWTLAKVPKPNVVGAEGATSTRSDAALPQTLVRIPVEQQPSPTESQETSAKAT